MSATRLDPKRFRRRFVNDRFFDVVAVPPGMDFKRDYEAAVHATLKAGSKLSHYLINSEYRRAGTPEWVYAMFGLKK